MSSDFQGNGQPQGANPGDGAQQPPQGGQPQQGQPMNPQQQGAPSGAPQGEPYAGGPQPGAQGQQQQQQGAPGGGQAGGPQQGAPGQQGGSSDEWRQAGDQAKQAMASAMALGKKHAKQFQDDVNSDAARQIPWRIWAFGVIGAGVVGFVASLMPWMKVTSIGGPDWTGGTPGLALVASLLAVGFGALCLLPNFADKARYFFGGALGMGLIIVLLMLTRETSGQWVSYAFGAWLALLAALVMIGASVVGWFTTPQPTPLSSLTQQGQQNQQPPNNQQPPAGQ